MDFRPDTGCRIIRQMNCRIRASGGGRIPDIRPDIWFLVVMCCFSYLLLPRNKCKKCQIGTLLYIFFFIHVLLFSRYIKGQIKVDGNGNYFYVKNNQISGRTIRQNGRIPDIRRICRISDIRPDIRQKQTGCRISGPTLIRMFIDGLSMAWMD